MGPDDPGDIPGEPPSDSSGELRAKPSDGAADHGPLHPAPVQVKAGALSPAYRKRVAIGTGAWAGGAALSSLLLAGTPLLPLAWVVLPVFPVTLLVDALARRSPEDGILAVLDEKLDDLWESGGGGFYASMTATTFLRLEALSLWEAFAGAGSLGEFVRGQFLEVIFRFGVDTILNTVWSVIWPLGWFSNFTLSQIAILGLVGYGLFLLARILAGPDSPLD